MLSKTEVWAFECPLCWHTYEPSDRPDDGRCGNCEESPKLHEKQSQFGAGLVVCLAKLTEHFGDQRYRKIWEYHRWLEKPVGPSPQKREEESFDRYPALRRGETPQENAMHEVIHMWAGAAGDHMFDLDREKAPPPLIDLADLMIELRNDHMADKPRLFTIKDIERVDELWRASCIALDQMLGTVPNWGSW